MFLTTEFNAGTAAIGAGVSIIAILIFILIYALDFFFTMYIYNNVAPKGSNAIRIICTSLICFAFNIVVTYIYSIINQQQGPVFTTQEVVGWLIDAFIGVLIAKVCTDRFRGSLWTKSFKGAILYIVVSIIIFVIFTVIFAGTIAGGFLPAAIQSGSAA